MGFHNTDSNSDGVVDADVNTSSVTTTDLFDLADGGEWETLNDLGYDQGQFVTVNTFSTRAQQTTTASSSTYQDAYVVNEFLVQPDQLPATMYYRGHYRGHPRGDALYVQLYNDTDAEGVTNSEASITGTSWQNFTTGVQSYSPATTGSPIAINPQIHNSDGSTGVDLAIAQVEIGGVL